MIYFLYPTLLLKPKIRQSLMSNQYKRGKRSNRLAWKKTHHWPIKSKIIFTSKNVIKRKTEIIRLYEINDDLYSQFSCFIFWHNDNY